MKTIQIILSLLLIIAVTFFTTKLYGPTYLWIIFFVIILLAFFLGTSFPKILHVSPLNEKDVFKILSLSSEFEAYDISKPEGEMIVEIDNTGKALVSLPTNPEHWKSMVPKIGDSYIVIKNCFIKL